MPSVGRLLAARGLPWRRWADDPSSRSLDGTRRRHDHHATNHWRSERMARRQQREDTAARTGRRRGYRRGRLDDDFETDDDPAALHSADGLAGRAWESPGDPLARATIEDLWEFADELQIEDYESLNRTELVREIRRETRSDPGIA
jgi:hypothetical protein